MHLSDGKRFFLTEKSLCAHVYHQYALSVCLEDELQAFIKCPFRTNITEQARNTKWNTLRETLVTMMNEIIHKKVNN